LVREDTNQGEETSQGEDTNQGEEHSGAFVVRVDTHHGTGATGSCIVMMERPSRFFKVKKAEIICTALPATFR
jgi:hypothetical protein